MRSYQRSFSSRYVVFVEALPAVEVGQRRDPHRRPSVERLVVGEVVRRADHAAAHVAQLVAASASRTCRESLKNVIVRSWPSRSAGASSVAIVSQNDSWPGARASTTGWPSSHSRIVSHQPADESTLRPSSSSPFSSTTPRDAAVLDCNPLHAAAQLQLAAQRAELAHEVLEDQPHAGVRAGQALPGRCCGT